MSLTNILKKAPLFVFILISFQTFAGQIVVTNTEKEKSFAANEGDIIKVWTSEGLLANHDGRFKVIDTENIEIKWTTIALSDIQKIRISPKPIETIGMICFIGGTTILAGGAASVINAGDNSNSRILAAFSCF